MVTLLVADPAAVEAALARRTPVVEGALLARDLINEPANVLGTEEFAARAAELAGLGVGIEILGEPELAALGMRSMLSVSQGSARPPRLVVMRWQGGAADAAPVAFVGKGVVFDSGGISIKPAGGMEDMKGDMGGAAAVVGLMHALAARKRDGQRRRHHRPRREHAVRRPPCGRATSCAPPMARRSRSSTPTPRAGSSSPTRSGTRRRSSRRASLVDLATLTGAIGVALGSRSCRAVLER